MRLRILAGLSVTALLFASGEAVAGQSVAFKSSWTGFHAGITGGYGWGQSELSAAVQGVSEDGHADLHGGMIGGLAGYDYDFGNGIVAGIVGDFSWSGINGGGCMHPAGISCATSQADMNVDLNWLATARLRAGYKLNDDFLIYATGGIAFGGVDVSVRAPEFRGSDSQTQVGWALGAGMEYRISEPVTIGLEYLYVDLGKQSYDFSNDHGHSQGDLKLDTQMLRATLQWRF